MNFSYGLPSFGAGQSTGPSAQYPYPPTSSYPHQTHPSSSYTHANAPAPAAPSYPGLNLDQPAISAGFDTSAPVFHPSEQDPSLYYDPRNANFLPLSTRLDSKDVQSKSSQRHEQIVTSIASRYQDDHDEYSPTSHHPEIAQRSIENENPPNISDDELEEGELSEDGSHASLQDNTRDRLLRTRPTGMTDGACDDMVQRSIVDSQRLTRNLIVEMYSWGVTFDDMVREVDHPEQLRASFLEAGLPVTTHDKPRMIGDSAVPSATHTTKDGTQHSISQMRQGIAVPQDGEPELMTSTSAVTTTELLPVVEVEVSSINGDGRPLDRKALIAQKLAAKSVIARASPATDRKQTDVSASTSRPEDQLSGNRTGFPRQQSESPSGTPSDLEAQKKAQTELARRRMEALKQKMAGKDASNQATLFDQVPRAPLPSMPTPPALLTNDIEPQMSAPPRKSSYFSPVSQSQLFSIPGLMPVPDAVNNMEARSDPEQDLQQNSHEDSHPSLEKTGLPEPRHRPQSAFIPDDPVHASEPGHASRPKRLEASDFIDVAETSTNKSHLDADAGVIIDISDEESDQSDDDHAIIVSQASLTRSDLSKDTNSSTTILRAGQPIAQRQKPQLTSSTSASGTPKALLTPRAQEDEDLKSKELKIQSLTRKIAELEAKRLGKRDKVISGNMQFVSQVSGLPVSQSSTLDQLVDATLPQTVSKHRANSALAVEPFSISDQQVPPPKDDFQRLAAKDSQVYDASKRADDARSVSMDPAAHEATERSAKRHGDDGRGTDQSPTHDKSSRCTEIEQGIPLLDKEIGRARQKLISLKQQEFELEVEIQRGLDGKRMLMEELKRLLQDSQNLRREAEHLNSGQADFTGPKANKLRYDTLAQQNISPGDRVVDTQAVNHVLTQPSNLPQTHIHLQRHDSASSKAGQTTPDLPELGAHLQKEDVIMDISESEYGDSEIGGSSDSPGGSMGSSLPQKRDPSQHEDEQPGSEDPHEVQESKDTHFIESNEIPAKGNVRGIGSNVDPEEEPLFDFDDEEMYEPGAEVDPDEPMELEQMGDDTGRIIEASPKIIPFDPLFDEMQISDETKNGDYEDESVNQGSEEEYEPPEPPEPGLDHDNTDQNASSALPPRKSPQISQSRGPNEPVRS